jgi:hypothetical protein
LTATEALTLTRQGEVRRVESLWEGVVAAIKYEAGCGNRRVWLEEDVADVFGERLLEAGFMVEVYRCKECTAFGPDRVVRRTLVRW